MDAGGIDIPANSWNANSLSATLWRMRTVSALVLAGVLAAPMIASAHFKLVEPASWLVEDGRGDPQKAGPCGGSNTDWGKPSYAVTKATGGSNLTSRSRKRSITPASTASRWR